MININCTLNCFFEQEGKCNLTHVSSISSTPHPSCLYYVPKSNGEQKQKKIKTEH